MRLLLFALVALALGLLALWATQPGAGSGPRGETAVTPDLTEDRTGGAPDVAGAGSAGPTLASRPGELAPDPARLTPVAAPPLLPPPRGKDVALAADVYLAQDDGTLIPGVTGHVELRVFAGGVLETRTVPVEAGVLTCFVPERSSLRLGGAVLNGQTARFTKPAGPFEPRGDRLALVGEPLPRNVVRVVVAGTGADLTDLTVREVDGPGSGRLLSGSDAPVPAERAPLLTGATSPVTLPWLDTRRPLWLEFAAPGYAPARALIDPRKPGERTLELHPASGPLTVLVSGPGRGKVDGLVMQRAGDDAARPVVAHVRCGAGAQNAPDPRRFELDALPVGRVVVRATFLDPAAFSGSVRDLATAEVELQPGAAARVDLYVP